MIIISAGFDAAIGDPIGDCCLSSYGYSIMLDKLMEFASGKIVMALEGGYNPVSLANATQACVEVLLQDKPFIRSLEKLPLESTWPVIQAVRQALCVYWPILAAKLAGEGAEGAEETEGNAPSQGEQGSSLVPLSEGQIAEVQELAIEHFRPSQQQMEMPQFSFIPAPRQLLERSIFRTWGTRQIPVISNITIEPIEEVIEEAEVVDSTQPNDDEVREIAEEAQQTTMSEQPVLVQPSNAQPSISATAVQPTTTISQVDILDSIHKSIRQVEKGMKRRRKKLVEEILELNNNAGQNSKKAAENLMTSTWHRMLVAHEESLKERNAQFVKLSTQLKEIKDRQAAIKEQNAEIMSMLQRLVDHFDNEPKTSKKRWELQSWKNKSCPEEAD